MYCGELFPDIATPGQSLQDIVPVIQRHLKQSVDMNSVYDEQEKQPMQAAIDRVFSLIQPTNESNSEIPRLRLDKFEVECLVGLGGFGSVWKASTNGCIVALKQHDNISVNALSRIWKERDVLIKLQHPRICKLFGVFYENQVFFVLNLCCGSVATLRNRINPINACRFAVHLLQAVDWIHSMNFIHADIKSDNCLINTDNQLVLSDFGSAQILPEGKDYVVTPTHVGTYGYMDLAATRDQKYSKATDMFGAACVIYEMDEKAGLLFCYELPTPNAEFYIDAFENGRLCGFKASLHVSYTDIASLERMTLQERCDYSKFGQLLIVMIDPGAKLSAIDALAHPILEQIMSDFGITFDNVDDSSYSFVTKEFNHDYRVPFEPPQLHTNVKPELILSFASLHYDNMEAMVKKSKKNPADPKPSSSTSKANKASHQKEVKRSQPLSAVQRQNTIGRFKCRKCPLTFTRKDNLTRHVKEIHDKPQDETYPCGICGKSFLQYRDLIDHKRVHRKYHNIYRCRYCGKEYAAPRACYMHEKRRNCTSKQNIVPPLDTPYSSVTE